MSKQTCLLPNSRFIIINFKPLRACSYSLTGISPLRLKIKFLTNFTCLAISDSFPSWWKYWELVKSLKQFLLLFSLKLILPGSHCFLLSFRLQLSLNACKIIISILKSLCKLRFSRIHFIRTFRVFNFSLSIHNDLRT